MPLSDKITFNFKCGARTLALDDTRFSVVDYSGLEAADYEITADGNINADGATKKRMRVLPRDIQIEFDYIKSAGVPEVRQELIRFFTPYKPGVLTVNYMGVERSIDYEVKGFRLNSKNVHDKLSALVTVTCMDPSFKNDEKIVNIITLIGGWKFRFKLPFRLKQYGELERNIYNSGDVKTPIEAYFKGPAVMPTIYKKDTGEYIRLKKDISAGETLYINTGFRTKAVRIIKEDGTSEDAWDYLDMTSTFFWLDPGDNMVSYSHTGTERTTGVEVRYKERFIGI